MNKLKKTLICGALSIFFITWIPTTEAKAAGAFGCGTMCMSQGGGMFRPFNGMPFFPVNNPYYQARAGQMGYYGYGSQGFDPRFASNVPVNWMTPLPYSQPWMNPASMPMGASGALMF